MLKQAVDDAVAALPPAQDGRDALQLEIQPFIDEGKSYPRGSYATHNGGLWRAYEKTHGMRGWECIVDGVSDVDISMNGQRNLLSPSTVPAVPVRKNLLIYRLWCTAAYSNRAMSTCLAIRLHGRFTLAL